MLKVPFFGIMLLATRNILFDRDDNESSTAVLRKSVKALKEWKKNLWIFPEGTRSLGKGLGEFKKGAFFIAIAAKAPIILIINQSLEHVLDVKKKKIFGGTHHVNILPPIETKDLKLREPDDLQAKVEAIFHKYVV